MVLLHHHYVWIFTNIKRRRKKELHEVLFSEIRQKLVQKKETNASYSCTLYYTLPAWYCTRQDTCP